MNTTVWSGIGATVVGALFTAWKLGLRQWWRQKWEDRREREVMANARRFVQLYGIAREWLSRKQCQRVLILYARNSGSPWRPETPVRVSCMVQVVAPSDENTWDRWQDWSVDPWYRTFLSDVLRCSQEQKAVRLVTDLSVDGVLKNAYVNQGTASSIVFPIALVPVEYGLVYVSLNFGRRLRPNEKELPQDEKDAAIARTQEIMGTPDRIHRMIQEGRAAWSAK